MGDDTMVPCSVCGQPGHWESSHRGDFQLLQKYEEALRWYAQATYPDDGSGRPPHAFQARAKEVLGL